MFKIQHKETNAIITDLEDNNLYITMDGGNMLIHCGFCKCISFKECEKDAFECAYCGTTYYSISQRNPNYKVVRHTAGRQYEK